MKNWLWFLAIGLFGCVHNIYGQSSKYFLAGRNWNIEFADSANFKFNYDTRIIGGYGRYLSRPNGSICALYYNESGWTIFMTDSSYNYIKPQPFFPSRNNGSPMGVFFTGFDSFTAYSFNQYEKDFDCVRWQKEAFGNNPFINACDYVGKYGVYSKNFVFRNNKPEMIEDLKQIITTNADKREIDFGPNIRRIRNFEYGGVKCNYIGNGICKYYSYKLGKNWATLVDSFTWDISTSTFW